MLSKNEANVYVTKQKFIAKKYLSLSNFKEREREIIVGERAHGPSD